MSIYDTLDYKIENPAKDPDRVKEVHAKIEKLVNEERPNPEDFRGIIPDAQINEDLRLAANLEKRWALAGNQENLESKYKADIAEYIIYKNLGGWIDQKAVVLPSAKPDDYLRGIDLIIESEKGDSKERKETIDHLGIGIDVALATDRGISEAVEKKKNKVRMMLRTGRLTEARYVSGGSFKGKIEDLAYTMIIVSNSHVEDLFSSATKSIPGQKEQGHILKYIVAYQIMRQLGTYFQVVNQKGRESAAYEYGKANNFAYELMEHLINEMNADADITAKVMNDTGVREIEAFCHELEKDLT